MSLPRSSPSLLLTGALALLLIGSGLWAYGARPLSHRSAPPLNEQVLADPLLSGGAVRAEVELLPPDELPLLNGQVTSPQAAHDAADAKLSVQVRFTGSGILGARTGGESVPYLRVRATVTHESTGATTPMLLRPTVGLEEGWHYASNLDLPGNPATDRYRIVVRIEPPAVLRTEPDFLVTGTILDSAAEIAITGVQLNLQAPPAKGSFPVTVREGLTS
ncbi:MAG: iron transporter [Armatimonadetes bacterium]|nr:iron transporter [Armatimonadota bacterium]